MERMRIGIIIIPPFIMISISVVASGAVCAGSEGAAEIVLFSVSKVCEISMRNVVMIISFSFYVLNEVF
jgi:hypothetical protein